MDKGAEVVLFGGPDDKAAGDHLENLGHDHGGRAEKHVTGHDTRVAHDDNQGAVLHDEDEQRQVLDWYAKDKNLWLLLAAVLGRRAPNQRLHGLGGYRSDDVAQRKLYVIVAHPGCWRAATRR